MNIRRQFMPVISILNQKGGSGKTTIAINLARAYQWQGYSVLLVDSDKQGSSRDWQSANPENPLPLLVLDKVSIDRDIKKIIDQYDYIIIDGSPQATEIAIATIRASDFILIPMQPSPFDIWASSNLIELVKQGITKKTELRAGIVLTRMVKNTSPSNVPAASNKGAENMQGSSGFSVGNRAQACRGWRSKPPQKK